MKKDFAPILGESLHGLIARWCAANHFDRMIDLTGSTGLEHPHRQTLEFRRNGFETIAREMGLAVPDLVLRSAPLLAEGSNLRAFYGAPVAKYDLDLRRRRFAPAGLAKSPHHRALWQVRVLPACIETMQYLTSTCPRCGSKQGWHHTIGVDLCDRCIRPLASAPGEAVPPHLHDRLELSSSIIHPDPDKRTAALFRLPRAISDLGAGAAFDLLVRLMPVVEQRVPLHRQRVADAPPLIRAEAMAAAWDVLAAWPDGFSRVASERIADRRLPHRDGNRGATMAFLGSRDTGFVGEGTARAIRELRRSLDLGENLELRHATLTNLECARAIGRDQVTIARLRTIGALPAIFAIDNGIPVPRILRSDIDHVATTLADRMTLEAARLPFGISCHGVEQLVAMGLLYRLRHPFFEANYDGLQISAASVAGLLAAFETRGREADRIDGVRLSDAMKLVGGRLKPWGPVISALLAGTVAWSLTPGGGPLAHRIILDPGQAHRIAALSFDARDHADFLFSATMSKVDAAEALNVTSARVTRLLSNIATAPGSHSKAVPVDYVERLARDYMSNQELGAILGIPARAADYAARCAGFAPGSAAGFLRAEIEELLAARVAQDAETPADSPGATQGQPRLQADRGAEHKSIAERRR